LQTSLKLTGNEQFVKDSQGNLEYVIIPYHDYEKIIELLEDNALGKAMQETESDEETLSKTDALKLLYD
jgi:hypothetical protein